MPIITDDEKTVRIADERVSREHEKNDYQNNADRYTAMLAVDIPALPAGMEQYLNTDLTKLPPDTPLADARILAQHQRQNRLKISIITEQAAADHIDEIIVAVDTQLPAGAAKATALDAAVIRRNAALAKG
jgi:hypothetical protein